MCVIAALLLLAFVISLAVAPLVLAVTLRRLARNLRRALEG